VVVVGPKDAPRFAVRRWCDARRAEGKAVLLVESAPDTTLCARLSSRPEAAGTAVTVVASGEAGTELWAAWRRGETGACTVLVSDPYGVPGGPLGRTDGRLVVRMAKSAPFIDPDLVARKLAEDGMGPPEVVVGQSSAWWAIKK